MFVESEIRYYMDEKKVYQLTDSQKILGKRKPTDLLLNPYSLMYSFTSLWYLLQVKKAIQKVLTCEMSLTNAGIIIAKGERV